MKKKNLLLHVTRRRHTAELSAAICNFDATKVMIFSIVMRTIISLQDSSQAEFSVYVTNMAMYKQLT